MGNGAPDPPLVPAHLAPGACQHAGAVCAQHETACHLLAGSLVECAPGAELPGWTVRSRRLPATLR
jgi:hypothetical protein